jgi:hypothetical protein
MLVLLLTYVGWREVLAWNVQIGPVILGDAPWTTGWWHPAVCHEPFVNVNNLGCRSQGIDNPLLTSEP